MTGVSMSPRSESLGQRESSVYLTPNAISQIVPNIHIGSRNRATRVCAAERSSQARPANAVARFVVRAAQGSTLGMLPGDRKCGNWRFKQETEGTLVLAETASNYVGSSK